MKRRSGVVVGLPNYARYLAKLVNETSPEWHLRAFREGTRLGTVRAALATRTSDVLICFGGPAPNVALLEVAHECRVPVVVIWAGSDVLTATDDPALLQTVRVQDLTHISDSPWLVDELRILGIDAAYVPVTAISEGPPIRELSNEFRVLTYLPEPRRDFYGRALVYDVARSLPHVPFVVVGHGNRDPAAPANVHYAGQVSDVTSYIDSSSALLRVPEHDGKSMFVLEALARGRHVLWNYSFPYCQLVSTSGDIVAQIESLAERHNKGDLQLNHDGRTYALSHFRRDAIAEGFVQVLNAAVKQGVPRAKERPCTRVAVSGLPLFCAQVAQAARLHAPECEVRIMHSDTRLQVLTAVHTLIKSDVWYCIGSARQDRLLRIVANVFRKPQVMHWVGSDILHLEDRQLRDRLKGPLYTHLAEVDWTQRELSWYGIEAGVAPLPVRYGTDAVPPPLPEQFTLLLYIPRHRSECYGLGEYSRLMRDLAGEKVRYIVVGGGQISVPPGVDAENLGWREDLTAVYERSTVLLRFTPRDGLSLMALEALSFGRYVIWTQPFPQGVQVTSYRELLHAVRRLLDKHKAGLLKLNESARDYVHTEYDADVCTRRLADIWLNLSGGAGRSVRTTFRGLKRGGRFAETLPREGPDNIF